MAKKHRLFVKMHKNYLKNITLQRHLLNPVTLLFIQHDENIRAQRVTHAHVDEHEEWPDFEHLKWPGNGHLLPSAQNIGRLPDNRQSET